MGNYFWGIDIGGTKTAVGIFDEKAKTVVLKTVPTKPEDGFLSLMDRIEALAKALSAEQNIPIGQIVGAGVACPGPLDLQKGKIVYIPTMGFRDEPLVAALQVRLGVPVVLENDTNAAVIGECAFGKGRGFGNVAYVTVSTGIGCGIAVNGRIVDGGCFAAGELGHMKTERNGRSCSCGGKGCLETYASGTAIARIASETVGHPVDTKDVFAAARRGEEPFLGIVRQAADHLALALGTLYQILDPEIVILGGSVMKDFDVWQPLLAEKMEQYTQPIPSRSFRLEVSEFDGAQVVMGAAWLAKRQWEANA